MSKAVEILAEMNDLLGNHYLAAELRRLARVEANQAELLEAAQLCRPYMYEHASNTQDNAFDKLCAAIAKATGEQL